MHSRVRSNSESDRAPPALLPTINTEQSDRCEPTIGTNYPGSPVFRRHSRKRSSTVLIPPRVSSGQASAAGTNADSNSAGPQTPGKFTSFASGAGALAGAQVLSKALTFVLNQLALRFVSARELGASAQLEFGGITVLSLARDAVRFASQRQALAGCAPDEYRVDGGPVHGTISGTVQETVNLGYLSIAAGLPLAAAMTGLMWWAGDGSDMSKAAAAIYGLAAAVEVLAEPCFLVTQLKMELGQRARIEAQGAIARTAVSFALIALLGSPPILAFAAGQLAYALVVCGAYYLRTVVFSRHESFKLYLKRVWGENDERMLFDPAVSRRAAGMAAQAVLKYFLTEGDRIAVSLMISLEQQGVYALAANYGSLLARLALFPIEEALRGVFAKTLPQRGQKSPPQSPTRTSTTPLSPTGPAAVNAVPATGAGAGAGAGAAGSMPSAPGPAGAAVSHGGNLRVPTPPSPTRAKTVNAHDVDMAATVLTTTLRVYVYLGIIASTLGVVAAPYVLSLVVNKRWADTDAPRVFAAYMIYLPFLAWNGALEAFVQSTASLGDLKRQGTAMMGFAAAFVVISYVFVSVFHRGAVGLVAAQMVTMMLRIAWALGYARAYFAEQNQAGWLARVLPNRLVLATAVLVAAAAWGLGTVTSFKGLVVDAGLGGLLVSAMAYSERPLLMRFVSKSKRE